MAITFRYSDYLDIIISQFNLNYAVSKQTKIDTIKKALNSPNIGLKDYLDIEVIAYRNYLL
ncbi:MAG: hypothetical protein HRU09_19475 [Oligoflexales bacterium]|nr:hypothetical protein [Oligoflexales bacterium]